MRKLIYWLTAIFCAAVLLAGCGPGGWVGQSWPPVLAYSSLPAAGDLVRQKPLAPSILNIYAHRPLLWHNANGRPTRRGQELYKILATASFHGLRPGDYLPADMREKERLYRSEEEQLYLIDQTLTSGLYDFAGDLVYGRFNSNVSTSSRVALFESALSAQSLTRWTNRIEQKGRSYQDLKASLHIPNITPAMRSAIAMNMERLRWVPEADWRGPHIRVNIAAAMLEAFNGRRLQDDMRVVIGQVDRQTPRMVNPIIDLKFSPDWTVPSSIVAKDFWPKLRQNPKSLDPSIYDVRVRGVRASQVQNWGNVRASDVFIRRASSDVGPLGGVRFSMYNPRAIFLHDTPQRHLFDRPIRAYSSGCIRVHRAEDLSAWILSYQNKRVSRNEIRTRMNAGETSSIRLNQEVPASLQYMTVYVDGRGNLKNAPDVYNLDKDLAHQMGLTIAYIDF